MEAEVTPEPEADEREAILVALGATPDPSSPLSESAWRRTAIHEAVEGVERPHP